MSAPAFDPMDLDVAPQIFRRLDQTRLRPQGIRAALLEGNSADWAMAHLADYLGLSVLELVKVARDIREHLNAEEAYLERVTSGAERVCHGCGCSETRACSGGCIWATATHCSRCV